MKKVTFVNQKRHLVGTLFTIYKHFGDFVNCIFTILLQILNENKFYLPVNTDKPKFVGFFDICLYDCFIFRSNSSSANVSKRRDAILAPVAKQRIAKDILS